MVGATRARFLGSHLALAAVAAASVAVAVTPPAAASAPRFTGLPKLVPTGPVEIVWNQTANACPGVNAFGHVGEQPDSMPVAWHSPVAKQTSLISATDWGTFPTVGPSLNALTKHDCSHRVYTSVNATNPARFAAHQWLQSALMFPNGSGAALVHSEFHGDVNSPPHTSLCSFNITHRAPGSECQLWSTSLAATTDGGSHWRMAREPTEDSLVFAAPRRYAKDQPISGFGAIGSMVEREGFHYGHVMQSDAGAAHGANGTTGVCAFRTPNVFDPTAYRGWNGSAWSTTWVDPYTAPSGTLSHGHVCAVIDTGVPGNAHPNPRTFAGTWLPQGWPTHVMLGWPEGTARQVGYAFPAWQGDGDYGAFTKWQPAGENLDITSWVPPSLGLSDERLMYPSLLDADSPFALGAGTSPGLSYGLVGNRSLFVYFVIGRRFIARIPVAWVAADAPTPTPPFPPPPPNPVNCTRFSVRYAGRADVNGEYAKTNRTSTNVLPVFELDASHKLYAMCSGGSPAAAAKACVHATCSPGESEPTKCSWRLAHEGVAVYYDTDPVSGRQVPVSGWRPVEGTTPVPTVTCADDRGGNERPLTRDDGGDDSGVGRNHALGDAGCDMTPACVAGVASTVGWYLGHGVTFCDDAWSKAVADNAGPHSPHHRCPAAPGDPLAAWLDPDWRRCVGAVAAAAKTLGVPTCTPDPAAAPAFITLPPNDTARCLDGSPYAFFVRPGDPRRVQIGLHGGGWCFNEADCLERSKMWLGSSRSWNASNAGGGSPPALGCGPLDNCTSVFLPYCDGSSFSSFREQPHPVPNASAQLWFRGAANLDRVIDVLMERYGLGQAEEVIVTGGSAGGLSTLLHLDRVASRVPWAKRVVGMPDAGYFIDHAPIPSTATSPRWYLPNYTAQQRYAFAMFNSSGALSAECQAKHAPTGDGWKCYMAQWAAPFVKHPFFALQSRFDEWQLSQILRLPCIQGQSYFPPYKAPTCNATEKAAVLQYGASVLSALAPVLDRKDCGIFLVSCVQHGVGASIGNVTPAEAFASWYTAGALGSDSGYRWLNSGCGSTVCNPSPGCAPL